MAFELSFDGEDIRLAKESVANITVAKSIIDRLQAGAIRMGKPLLKNNEKFFVSMDGILGYQYQVAGETQSVLVVEVKDDKYVANTLPKNLQDERFDSVAGIKLNTSYAGAISGFRALLRNVSAIESMDLSVDGGYDMLNYVHEKHDDYRDSNVSLVVGQERATLKIDRRTQFTDENFAVKSKPFHLSDLGLNPDYVLDPGNQVTAALAYITDCDFLEEALNNVGEDLGVKYPEASFKGILMYAAINGEIDTPRRQILTAMIDDADNRQMLMDALLEPWASKVLPEPIQSELIVNLIDLDCDTESRNRRGPKV